MQGDQEGKKGRREVWGRVPKDWEMGGIKTEGGEWVWGWGGGSVQAPGLGGLVGAG